MRKLITLLLALATLPAGADLPRGVWRTARPIALPTMPAAGLVYLPLDERALAGVRSVAEYRVVRNGRHEVPYRMVLEEGQSETRALTPTVVSRATLKKEQAQVVVDLGAHAPPANRIDLSLRGDNFRCRVRVEGSRDRKQWWLITQEGIVYRHEARFEQTTVVIPPSEYQFLRITLQRLQGALPAIEGVQVASVLTIPRRLVAVKATLSRRQDARARKTLLILDMGKVTWDVVEARFDIAEPTFDRPMDIEAGRLAAGTPPKISYEWVESTGLQRLAAGKPVVVPVRVPAARRLRISIFNGDDPPLNVRGVTLWRVRRGLIFSADPAQKYELWYGRRNAPAPVYEMQRLPMAAALATLPEASLGPARSLPIKPPPPPPWSERHRTFFWVILLVLLVLLVVVILRAMRGVKTAAPGA